MNNIENHWSGVEAHCKFIFTSPGSSHAQDAVKHVFEIQYINSKDCLKKTVLTFNTFLVSHKTSIGHLLNHLLMVSLNGLFIPQITEIGTQFFGLCS